MHMDTIGFRMPKPHDQNDANIGLFEKVLLLSSITVKCQSSQTKLFVLFHHCNVNGIRCEAGKDLDDVNGCRWRLI